MKNIISLLTRSFSTEQRSKHLGKLFEPFHRPNSFKECTLNNSQILLLKRASVLVLISYNKKTQEYEYTLTKRTNKLRNHSGQISFVGGMSDKSDSNEVSTAYREAYEEIGIKEDLLNLIGQLYPIVTAQGVLVTPVVAFFNDQNYLPCINQDEVEFLFKISTRRFLSNQNHIAKKYENFYVHSFLDKIDDREVNVWGVTAKICICVSSIIHQQNPNFDADPFEKFEFVKLNQYLENYLLVKSKPLINGFVTKPKETENFIKSLM